MHGELDRVEAKPRELQEFRPKRFADEYKRLEAGEEQDDSDEETDSDQDGEADTTIKEAEADKESEGEEETVAEVLPQKK